MSAPVQISVVVPVYNEVESLPVLHREIASALESTGRTFEVIYVDDCSDDGSFAVLLSHWRADRHVRVVRFRKNAGQTAAMAAGFDLSRGDVVITLDADLQNDPADIPDLLAELDRGYDFVVGWRKRRQDGFILRRLPSIVANRLIAIVTGVDIHDTGCTLKAMRRQIVEELPIYAEQHRFLPAMSASSGARVSEIVVNHRPRRFGRSKYGIGRAFRVLGDLFIVKMISSFTQRPAQYFGMLALPFFAATLFLLASGLVHPERLNLQNRWGQSVLIAFLLLSICCVYFILLGLLAELTVKVSGLHRRRVLSRIVTTSLDD